MSADFYAGLVIGVVVAGSCMAIGIAVGMVFIWRLYGHD